MTKFGVFIQMELQLLTELGFPVGPSGQPSELSKEGAHSPSRVAGFKTKRIARENASHFDSSPASCVRPAAVSR